MAREKLGREIADFVWQYGDWYEISDIYDSIDELITETIACLYDTFKRKAIALYLKEITAFSDYDDEALKAAELYRKVVELC